MNESCFNWTDRYCSPWETTAEWIRIDFEVLSHIGLPYISRWCSSLGKKLFVDIHLYDRSPERVLDIIRCYARMGVYMVSLSPLNPPHVIRDAEKEDILILKDKYIDATDSWKIGEIEIILL